MMADADRLLGMYLHLARASKMRRQPLIRAKLLVLAGVHAEEMGLTKIAALCRHSVLTINPRHLVRRWPTFQHALDAEAFQTHLKQLYRRYSREKIEHMMQSLNIEMGQEREAYFSDTEYAAALLNTRPEDIDAILSEPAVHRQQGRGDKQNNAVKPSLTPNIWLVWGPFIGGLMLLAALAFLSWKSDL